MFQILQTFHFEATIWDICIQLLQIYHWSLAPILFLEWNEMEFCILLQCRKFCDPVLFSSRLLQNVSFFLLIKRLEYLLTRKIILSMGETFLIPAELVFLDLNPC